ncbi:KR domain-containing protein [Aspergillus cavernicola]|uniref:KR domain-containing protein n=1 Tax=Aspergillus cavernicola TaxID=176166 RepID=A0ABR4IVS0_9EURO
MPGLLRVSRSSSSSASEDGNSTAGSTPPPASEDGAQYPAVSFQGYPEKPLNEQIEPIAIIGMGCRLPGDVKSPSDFWDMLINKKSGQTPKVPASRFNIDAHFHQNNDRPGSFAVLGGYFLNEELTDFDPGLFNITPIEAMWMDPQQRKLLEVVYETIESAGVSLEAISGSRTAVFAASFTADWQQMAFKEPSFRHSLAATGVDPGIISNRISHVFNLKGPSIVVNTACSSSVYAVHNACNALRNNEAEGAIVGGVNLIITVDQHMNTAKLGVLSPTSTCHTFDESADGYGRADAVGAVYLKRLSDAIRDGDPIRAVIRSSAVNSNGKVPAVGITHPNRDGQADVIAHAYERGGDLDPRLTGYFECHGTGTAVGDPLEVHAVSMAMNKNRAPAEDPLWIGAVKTNIGHSEAASGLSALIKAVLMVERGIIAPTRGLVKPSPSIKWDEWQVKVPTEPVPFPPHLPGADALLNGQVRPYTYHIGETGSKKGRLRKKDATPRRATCRKQPFLLPFSAHDKATLQRNINIYGQVAHNYSLLDLSHTLSSRRSALSSRAFTVTSPSSLADSFSDVASSFTFGHQKRKVGAVGFVFTGQGAQWPRMGAELITYSSHFLASIRALDEALEALTDGPDWSIEDILLEDSTTSRVNEAEFSQPLCTAIQIALVQLFCHWGIHPRVTVGHSSGEIAAAYAAGLIPAREAIAAAYYRGRVVRDVATDGAMLAVGLGPDAVARYLDGKAEGSIVVACHNSPSGVTLSGDSDVMDSVKARLDADQVFARIVKTNGKAYHSHHMAAVAEQYEGFLRGAKADHRDDDTLDLVDPLGRAPTMVSSVTNSVLSPTAHLDETYWSSNLQRPVLFNQALQTILTAEEFADVDLLIEIGPHSALASPIKLIKAELRAEKLDYLPTLIRGTDSAAQLLKLVGELFLRSAVLNWKRVISEYNEKGVRSKSATKGSTIIDLPPYQWNYTRPLWAENRVSREQRQPKYPRHDLLGQLVVGSSLEEPTWRNVLRLRDLPWLRDHSLGGEPVFPAAGYFSMAIEAITQVHELSRGSIDIDIQSYVLRDVSIKKAIVTPDNDDGIEIIFNLRPSVHGGNEWWDFSVSSIDTDQAQREHMAGSISIKADSPRGSKLPRPVPSLPQRARGKSWNQALRAVGFDYGPTFQDMDDIRFDGKRYEVSSRTAIKQQVDPSLGESRYVLHPATVDSVLQLSIAAIYAGRTNAMKYGVVPIQVDEVTIWPPTKEQIEIGTAGAYAWVPRRGVRSFEGSAQMTASDGQLVLEIVNVRTTAYEAAVPPTVETATPEGATGPYGELAWQLDIDSLAGSENAISVAALTVPDLVDLTRFKFPALKVLEFGTEFFLQNIARNLQVSYTIALPPGDEKRLREAREYIKDHSNLKVVELDLGENMESQSIKKGAHDVVVVSSPGPSILHVLRALVKSTGYIFASNCSERADWDAADSIGFNRVFRATTGASIWRLANAVESQPASNQEESRIVQLVYRNDPTPEVVHIQSALDSLGWDVRLVSLDNATPTGHIIIVADFEGPLLLTIKQSEFYAIQKFVNSASALLWVTTGGLLDGKKPEYALVQGLARSVGSEMASLDFRTLDIDLESATLSQISRSVTDVARLQVQGKENNNIDLARERELRLSNGNIYISRLVRNPGLNKTFTTTLEPEPTFFNPENRISGRIWTQGKVVFEQQQERGIVSPEPKPGHVEVQVQISGLTKEGVAAITGTDYPTTFSHEIGGVVTKVGAGITDVEVGDRVAGLHIDRFSSYQEVPVSLIQKLGDESDLATAVSLLVPYANAVYALDVLANLQAKEVVLVLHNTGTSGIAAVKIAQRRGAIPYVVAQTDSEVAFLHSQLGLSEAQVIRPSHGTVAARLNQLTDHHGADVIFSTGNSVDPGAAREAWRSIARFGRFVDAGRKNVLSRNVLDIVPVARSASYLAFDLLDLLESRPAAISPLLPTIINLFQQGSISAAGSLHKIHLGDIDKAVATFSESFDAPTPVVQYEMSETPIRALPPGHTRPRFIPDHTYFLVGCLGGLGRSLTTWMMESGARRFTFLSRSGTDAESAARLVDDITAAGGIVQVVRGDVASRDDVVRAVEAISAENPIRGVVHAAMVLRDGMFHSQTYENWKAVVGPKVLGAMNLHSVLAETQLDFFLTTSSVSGTLGTPGQTNYAAANSFLDAISRHRVSTRMASTSVVLPMVLGVGVVAQNTEIEEALMRKGIYGIDEEALLETFEAAITAPHSVDHVVAGLDPAKLGNSMQDAGAEDVFWAEDPRFSHVVHAIEVARQSDDDAAAVGQNIPAAIRSAESLTVAVAAVVEHFIEKLTRMLLLPLEAFDPLANSIASYGIDSMIGSELRNWIFKEYRIDIPFQQLLAETLTISKFATHVIESAGVTFTA